MRINKLKIENKEFIFHDFKNLIHSAENGVGKSTLVRCILFALGYNVPSMRGLDFEKLQTQIDLSIKDDVFRFVRTKDRITISNGKKSLGNFNAKNTDDHYAILSFIYGLTDPSLLNNILGISFFDQEKGWTLLNRGKVIGSISFNIESFISALYGIDTKQIENSIKKKKTELSKTKNLKELIETNHIVGRDNSISDHQISEFDDLSDNITEKNIYIRKITKNINELKLIIKSNENFMEMIENIHLKVRSRTDGIIIVNKNNIVDFELDQSIIKARIAVLNRQLDQLNFEKDGLLEELQEQQKLFDMATQLNRLDESVSKIGITPSYMDSLIDKQQNGISEDQSKERDLLRQSSNINEVYMKILDFAKELGVEGQIDKGKDFVFTNNLKRYGGANLHLVIFAFRMALLKIFQDKTGLFLPIILDSPATSEITMSNMKKMFQFVLNEFPNNQLIVASIYEYNGAIKWDKKIELSSRLLD
ncbi:hypothetical protein E2146_04665 [Oenococcus oeni]|nr:hypothetical protein E2146_04665 [Oenococcus oeni]TEU59032.1 hypothetical protein E2142_02935 [Oenococcus oeni]TEU59267.1 hypothetical protein E2144_08150 [Oenococcus oeni]